jgi:hypothetical protein
MLWAAFNMAPRAVRVKGTPLQRFVEQKILREITGQVRHRRFRYDPYIKLFTDEEPDPSRVRA